MTSAAGTGGVDAVPLFRRRTGSRLQPHSGGRQSRLALRCGRPAAGADRAVTSTGRSGAKGDGASLRRFPNEACAVATLDLFARSRELTNKDLKPSCFSSCGQPGPEGGRPAQARTDEAEWQDSSPIAPRYVS
jgi:hypothetical protein